MFSLAVLFTAGGKAVAAKFTMTRRVQFAETDMAGVMHFSNYFRVMEEVEHAYWRSLGLEAYSAGDAGPACWPRIRVECDYLAPLRFEDEIDLRLSVAELAVTSVTLEVEFRCHDRRVALGRVKAVCCAMEEGAFRPMKIPQTIRELLTS